MEPSTRNEGILGQYSRASALYPQDHLDLIIPTHQYEGKITQSEIRTSPQHSSPSSVRVIDGAIRMESVDEKTRQMAKKHFASINEEASSVQDFQKQGQMKGAFKVVFGGVGCAMATLGAMAPIPFLSLPAAAIFAVFGATTMISGGRQYIESSKHLDLVQNDIRTLNQESAKWEDPINDIISTRRKAGIEGFHFVLAHDLKDKIVHPEEVRALWMRDFKELLVHHSSISEVMDQDLLGEKAFSYSWNGTPVEGLEWGERSMLGSLIEGMVLKYRELRDQYLAFNAQIQGEFHSLERERQHLQREINAKHSHWLSPAVTMFHLWERQAEQLYNRAIEPFIQEKERAIKEVENATRYTVRNPLDQEETNYKLRLESIYREEINAINERFQNHPGVLSIKQAYQRDREVYGFLYSQSKLVVDAFFDHPLRLLKFQVEQSRQQIEAQQVNGMKHFSSDLKKILRSTSEEALRSLPLCPPEFSRCWKLTRDNRELTWNEVYGQQPQFQMQFAKNVSPEAWDLFWSQLNLHHAGHRQHGEFQFAPNCFNHYTHSGCSAAGIFGQPVCVPPPPVCCPP